MKEFLVKINEEVKQIVSSEFEVEAKNVDIVPSLGDTCFTFTNLTGKVKRGKIIETCVLYIDIRKSTEISLVYHSKTLSKLYSAFVRNISDFCLIIKNKFI